MLHKKILITVAALGISSLAFAAPVPAPFSQLGFYLGAQGGYARVSGDNGLRSFANDIAKTPGAMGLYHSKKRGDMGGRAYVGISFNPYVGLETGYAAFEKNEYKAGYYIMRPRPYSIDMHGKVSTSAWDIMARFTLPLAKMQNNLNQWSVYGAVGAAYVMSKLDFSLFQLALPPCMKYKHTNKSWRPAYAAGVSYGINKYLALNLSWYGFYGKNKIGYSSFTGITNLKDFAPTVNMFSLGLHIIIPKLS